MTEKTFDTIVNSLINDKIKSEKYNKNGINDIHIKNIDSALKELKELKEIKEKIIY